MTDHDPWSAQRATLYDQDADDTAAELAAALASADAVLSGLPTAGVLDNVWRRLGRAVDRATHDPAAARLVGALLPAGESHVGTVNPHRAALAAVFRAREDGRRRGTAPTARLWADAAAAVLAALESLGSRV